MHMREWILAAGALAGLAGPSLAQQPASTFFTGVAATQINNIPIDTSRAVIQHPAQAALTTNRFDFTTLFNKFNLPSWPPSFGFSALPSPSSFPSTKYQNFKTVGTPPFPITYMFGNKSPIQPVMPIIPSSTTPVGPGSG